MDGLPVRLVGGLELGEGRNHVRKHVGDVKKTMQIGRLGPTYRPKCDDLCLDF